MVLAPDPSRDVIRASASDSGMSDDGIQDRPAHLAATFNRMGAGYDGRPGYPDAVFRLLAERGLAPGSRVLEIGPGTGQATLPLLDRGAVVTAVEPGEELARLLRERCAGRPFVVIVDAFETAALPDEQFDLVVAATAFHWVDPDIGIARAAAHLRAGGHLALWWALWGDSDREDPFHERLEPILRAKAPHLVAPHASLPVYLNDIVSRMRRIDASGLFDPVEQDSITWDGVHSPSELRDMFATFAAWIALPEPLRNDLLDDVERLARDEFDGNVTRPYRVMFFSARRSG